MLRWLIILLAAHCFSTVNAAENETQHNLKLLQEKLYTFRPSRNITDFSFTTSKGVQRKIKDYKGQWLVINFWASYCHICLIELPQLDKLKHRLDNKNITLLTIAVDMKPDDITSFFKRLAIKDLTRFYVNNDIYQSDLFLIESLPLTVIIKPDTTLYGRLFGAADWSNESTFHFLNQLNQEP